MTDEALTGDEEVPLRHGKRKKTKQRASALAIEPARVLKRNARLRRLAMLIYCSSPQSPSVEKMHADPRFKAVAVTTLQRWCNKDGWVQARAEFLGTWQRAMENRLATGVAVEVQSQLDKLRRLEEDADDWLDSPENVPASWEGTANVKLKLLDRRLVLAERLQNLLGAPTSEAETRVVSDEEALAAARAALDVRMQTQKTPAQLPAPATTIDVDVVPVLERVEAEEG